jgi:hypothetical protein
MASIEITPNELVVHINGWDKILALRSTVRVPWSHVTGARARPEEAHFDDVIVDSWRGIGTYVPGKVAAGQIWLADGKAFYDVHDPRASIAIDVEHERVRVIVVQVDGETPEEAVARIQHAMDGRRAPPAYAE